MDWALFFSALLSSTLIPGGSEALLIYLLNEQNNTYQLVAIATIGNVLGSIITYVIGRIGNQFIIQRWFSIEAKKIHKAEQWFNTYGQPSLLFAWLPVVGDPLCLVAGILRSHLLLFILLVSIGKLARYSFIAIAV